MMHQGQKIVYEHPARFKFLAAGRRWRKTTLAMRAALRVAAEGQSVLWGAPTFRQCRLGWDELYRAAGGVASFRRQDMEVSIPPANGLISFVSLDNADSARGKGASLAIIDEAGRCPELAWQEVIRPTISDSGGAALVMGTPNGRNWFWREWMAASDRRDSQAWQSPTLGVVIADGHLERRPHPLENPTFLFQEAEQMFQTMPERIFMQEFLAEFVEDAGLVFRAVDMVSVGQSEMPKLNHNYVFGVDWGKSSDFTVISVFDTDERRQVYLDRFNQIDWVFQSGRLQALYDKWQPFCVLAEENAMGGPQISHLQQAGMRIMPFQTTNISKKRVIEALALAIERNEVILLDDEVQKSELKSYDVSQLPGGMWRYSAPEGMHDDTVMAMAIAWDLVGNKVSGSPFVVW